MTVATFARTPRRIAVVAVLAVALSGFTATSASANAGTVHFGNNGFGLCIQQVNGTLTIASPYMQVYGFSTTDQVRVWYRVVDDYGRAQSQWGDLGFARASATAPATFGGVQVNRGVLKQFSRLQFFIAWYAIFGQPGTHNPVLTQTVTLAKYVLYSYGGALPGLKIDGTSTACFG
jgi:hypothetical protein